MGSPLHVPPFPLPSLAFLIPRCSYADGEALRTALFSFVFGFAEKGAHMTTRANKSVIRTHKSVGIGVK